MKLLALDLGTKTGYALGARQHMISGTWGLKPSRWEGGGMVFVKFRANLDTLRGSYGITQVIYEEVRRHDGTDAAHRYGGLLGTLTAWCEEHSIPYMGVPVGTIKKSFTGNGNASKDAMIAECRRRGFEVADDNQADAIALFDWGLDHFDRRDDSGKVDGEMKPAPVDVEEYA